LEKEFGFQKLNVVFAKENKGRFIFFGHFQTFQVAHGAADGTIGGFDGVESGSIDINFGKFCLDMIQTINAVFQIDEMCIFKKLFN
jgi:hypothetical protein